MILYIENPKESKKKKVNKYSKVKQYKINTQKSTVSLYTSNEQSKINLKQLLLK